MEGVFLDTNVYVDWVDGIHLDLRAVLREAGVRVYLCPSVVLEALEDFWTCNPSRVRRHQDVLRLMQRDASFILPPEGATIRMALGLTADYNGPLSPEYLQECMSFSIGLTTSQRNRRSDGERGFDVDQFLQNMTTYRDQFINGREAFRQEIQNLFGVPNQRGFPQKHVAALREYFASRQWAETYSRNLLKGVLDEDTEITDDLVQRSIGFLAARLAFDTAVVKSMLLDGYNPRKHRGDCFDCGILSHLADSNLTLLTSDRSVLERAGRSEQAERTIDVKSLV